MMPLTETAATSPAEIRLQSIIDYCTNLENVTTVEGLFGEPFAAIDAEHILKLARGPLPTPRRRRPTNG